MSKKNSPPIKPKAPITSDNFLQSFGKAGLSQYENIKAKIDTFNAFGEEDQDKQATPNTEILRDYVTDADYFILHQTPMRGKLILWAATLFVGIFFLWAYLTNVNELVKGEAKVVPSSQLQILQSIDGGIVKRIRVSEGDSVVTGQALIEIDNVRYMSAVKKEDVQRISMEARIERLEAFINNRPFVISKALDALSQKIYQQESRFHKNQLNELASKKAQAQGKKDQSMALLASNQRELDLNKPLLKSGAVSEVEVLRLEREVNRLESEVLQAQDAINTVVLEAMGNARDELTETSGKLNALREGKVALQDKVNQTIIRAPMNGYIKRLLVNTVGGVVSPGNDVVEVIPSDDALYLETKVAPRDIAFLRLGQPCLVKFTAYDFAVYGGLDGELISIGADSITDEKNNTFFVVKVKTNKVSLRENLPIIPGMQAEVDINTGHKSILTYLMKPILRAKSSAFTER